MSKKDNTAAGEAFGYTAITQAESDEYVTRRIKELEGMHFALGINVEELRIDLDLVESPEAKGAIEHDIEQVLHQQEATTKKIERLRSIIKGSA